ncbi:dipeptide epimerase [Pleurocapsales cyanobacterium LEGE 06147]|nr:dipeptide epimerase [Pleurocapsales cyanobacterium LEGE 06147]
MKLTIETFAVHKRFPLQISRGTTAQTANIWVRIQEDRVEGWGEASPFSLEAEERKDTEQLVKELRQIAPKLEVYHPLEKQKIEEILQQAQLSSSVRAAIDMALHDWLGKKVGLPLWRLWGLDRSRIVPISVTVGINTPAAARQRVRDWQKMIAVKILKVKLGNPQGIEADRAMLLAIREQAPTVKLTVDANGGWNLNDAIDMCQWLGTQEVEYVEQPLPLGEEHKLAMLSNASPLPIFVDESCCTSRDIPRLADSVKGINIKIMKAGGLSEAMRMIHIARACGLKIMFGCYSDSSLANTAMSHLASLADYLDLDSHLNLRNDPFRGANLTEGCLLPNDRPGLGVEYCDSDS